MTARWRRMVAELLEDSPTTTSVGVMPLRVTVPLRTVPPGTGVRKVRKVREARKTGLTVRLTVAALLVLVPLLTLKVKASVPT